MPECRQVEQPGQALAALDLGQEHLVALGRRGHGQGGGDRGLARAALAGHDQQAGVEQAAGIHRPIVSADPVVGGG